MARCLLCKEDVAGSTPVCSTSTSSCYTGGVIETPVMFMTGAGLSAPSGIRTYRGKPDSLWNSNETEASASIVAASDNKIGFWRAWGKMRDQCIAAEPNAAHVALAEFTQRHEDYDYLLVTQNVDGLLQRAGAENVHEIHGSLYWLRCRINQCTQEDWRDPELHRDTPPECPSCRVPALPAMTFFGEYVERHVLDAMERMVQRCRTYVVVGSSGVVPPAKHFAGFAKAHGARTVLVNDHDWSDGDLFHDVHLGSCDEILPGLLAGV